MTLSPSQRADARAAVVHLALTLEAASAAEYTRVLDTVVAAEALGVPEALGLPAAPAAPIAHALATFWARQREGDPTALDALEAEPALLAAAERFVAPALAPALADRLAARDLLPSGAPLAALLATVDPGRCAALLDRLAADPARGPEALDATAAALLVYVDAGAAPPPALASRWSALSGDRPDDPDLLAAWFAARLRVGARQDPVAALPELAEATEEVGGPELGAAMAAVLARAVRADADAAWAFYDGLAWHHDRAHALEALCRAAPPGARAEAAFGALVDTLRRGGPGFDASPRGWFQATLALLALAARARRPDLGVSVVEAGGPPLSVLHLATWEGGRVASLRDGTWAPAFWDTLAAAALARGPGPAAAGAATFLPTLAPDVAAAWWRVATLPLPELPWYGAFGPRLP